MNVHFEELSATKRAGGIEAATAELAAQLRGIGVKVTRSAAGETCARPDCVHLHGLWSPVLARKFLAWQRQGVPCVVTPHGMLETWSLAHKRVKKWLGWHLYQKRLLQHAAVLHGTSAREIAQFKKLGLRPLTALVPWGVALPTQKRKPESGKRKAEIRTALFVGRIYPVKGLPMLMEAWAQARPAHWKLRIVGPDEAGHRAEVEAAAQKFGVRDLVEFTGELTGSDKDAAYQNADLFVLPSYTENFGMVVAEALAHHLPVLTTTGTPWRELSQRGCGWWVEPTVDQMGKALARATALDDATLRAMGEKGREWVLRDFTWQRTARQMHELYAWVIGARPQPAWIG